MAPFDLMELKGAVRLMRPSVFDFITTQVSQAGGWLGGWVGGALGSVCSGLAPFLGVVLGAGS